MARPDANLGLVGPGRFDMAPWIAAAAAITFLGLIVWCLVWGALGQKRDTTANRRRAAIAAKAAAGGLPHLHAPQRRPPEGGRW